VARTATRRTIMRHRLLTFALPVILAVSAVHFGTAGADVKPIEFSDARLKVEINATDGDAGLQIFLDGEAWNEVELLDPQGDAILDVDVTGRAEDFGLTELFSESSEPPSRSSHSNSSNSCSPRAPTPSGARPSTECPSPARQRSPTTSRRPTDPVARGRLEGPR
jgi:hypothetical protein